LLPWGGNLTCVSTTSNNEKQEQQNAPCKTGFTEKPTKWTRRKKQGQALRARLVPVNATPERAVQEKSNQSYTGKEQQWTTPKSILHTRGDLRGGLPKKVNKTKANPWEEKRAHQKGTMVQSTS